MQIWTLVVGMSMVTSSLAHDPGFRFVTSGSYVKLLSCGYRLHSHDIKYGTQNGGSGQQSITGMSSATDNNSLWKIHSTASSIPGDRITCGSQIKLEHSATGHLLHSHAGFVSPLTHQQEVTGYNDAFQGDRNDYWQVQCCLSVDSCVTDGSQFWTRDISIKLKHAETGKFLQMNPQSLYGNPIPGQAEVCGVHHDTRDSVWKVEEGVYIKFDAAFNQ